MVNTPLCTCGAATVLTVGDRPASSQSTPLVPYFLCTVCPTPLRIPDSAWASSAPEYLVSNPWRNYQILPAPVIPATTSVCQTAPGSTPPRRQQAISSSLAVSVTAKSSPPPTYEVALADFTARAFARQKKATSTRRTVVSKPKQSSDQVRAHLFALRETPITLACPSRSRTSLVALAVTVGVNPFGGRPLLVARLITCI